MVEENDNVKKFKTDNKKSPENTETNVPDLPTYDKNIQSKNSKLMSLDKSNNSSMNESECSSELNDSCEYVSEECSSDNLLGYNDIIESDDESYIWSDSMDVEQFTHEYKKASWLDNNNVKPEVKRKEEVLVVNSTEKVFDTTFKIRFINNFNNFIVIIDSFNILYVTDYTFNEILKKKITNSKISGLVYFRGKLLIYTETGQCVYELDSDLNLREIKNKCRGCKKAIVFKNRLYMLGDQLVILDEDLTPVGNVKYKLKDFIIFNDTLIGLDYNGKMIIFTENSTVIKNIDFDDRFSFIRLYSWCDDKVVILTHKGVKILNKKLELLTEVKTLKEAPSCILGTKTHLFYSCPNDSCIRFLLKDLSLGEIKNIEKIRFGSNNCLSLIDDKLYIGCGKYVLLVDFEYQNINKI
ncbi:hypothetical protein HERIO_1916 [Hepatospora eriocheir]|uniref:Uncharacterized protein n=1 Tax=Hepatospora eriocheir TaxID=1081669 RepID=A0A1X0Q8N0_9MICR|nr:hypothetical protein HERIO_1916 [Hepatospora eriocheir]